MTAIELLEETFQKKCVYDYAGNEYRLDSNIGWQEGVFLMQLIRKYKPQNSIEIGCAYGISSLFICSELEKTANVGHTVIDAFQSGYFKGIGILNLQKAGIDCVDFIEELSEIALPQLLASGRKFDFCFIDGNHTFDHTLIDFFYLNRMIEVGGIIVFDDAGMPAVKKLLRYLLNYPAYKQIDVVKHQPGLKKRLFNTLLKAPLGILSKLLPIKFRHEIFAGSIINSDKKMNLDASMIAIQKVKRDDRNWDWFKDF